MILTIPVVYNGWQNLPQVWRRGSILRADFGKESGWE